MTAPWPLPFPKSTPPIFDWDFDGFFLKVQENIRQSRQYRNQPPLVPNEQVLVGQEQESVALSPPSIVVIPRGYRYQAARHERIHLVPQLLWSAWLEMDVKLWGYEDPNQTSLLYSFSTTAELARQFLVACQAVNGGVPRVQLTGAQWLQKVDMNRLGRVLSLSVAVETYVAHDPPIQAPFSTVVTPGISFSTVANIVTAEAQSPASSITEAIFSIP